MEQVSPSTPSSFSLPRIKDGLSAWIQLLGEKDIFNMASAIAYYTVLSLTPFLLILLTVVSALGFAEIPDVKDQVNGVLGPSAGVVLQSIQDHLRGDQGGLAFGFFGLVTLLISATGVITELQKALDSIFAKSTPQGPLPAETSVIGPWVRTKAFSVLALIFCVFISTVSLVMSILIKVLLPIHDQVIWQVIDTLSSIVAFSLIFLLMFRYLPTAAHQSWSFCIRSGLLCSIFFHVGKGLIQAYFSHAGIESSYGALSSFVIFLIWAYYNALIILLSASLAQVYFREKI